MTEGQGSIDFDGVVGALCALGSEEIAVRDQLALTSDPEARLAEIAALAIESEAGLLLPQGDELDTSLFELVEGLRQSGVAVALGQTTAGPALVLGDGADARVLEVSFGAAADTRALVDAIAARVPESHRVLLAPDYESGDDLALVVLEAGQYARLRAAVGGSALDSVLLRPGAAVDASTSPVTLLEAPRDRLLAPDFAQRFRARLPEASGGAGFEAVFARMARYDPRVAWPEGHRRPPGDDFFELGGALAAEPLVHALASQDDAELANVLYRFALVTSVGAHWDVLAARQNPGMSAQGVLGMGQLTWAWFIFAALGAEPEAARVGRLLDSDWVGAQERASLSVRQRSWFDLGAFMRNATLGPALGKLRELLPLAQRAGWQGAEQVAAALAVHTEPRGDQLTHQPLFHVWPAPLYALARRAGANDLLPKGDPFLSRPLDVALVERSHALVFWLDAQLARLDALDESRLPPLLDPLPVIVDVRVTEVDAREAHGRTLLATREDAEHHVVAPHGGRAMKPGEVWLFEVQGARQTRARARHDDLGEVSFHIALPTGEWLSRADATDKPARVR